jgi:hypothetical protein
MGILLSGSVGMNIAIAGTRGDIAVPQVVIDQFKESVVEVIHSEVPGMIKPMADDVIGLKKDLADLKQNNIDDKTGRAITAYSKVFTIDDLKNSPEKRFSITQGLELDSCYNILFTMDRDRTVLFYKYLIEDSL